MSGQLTLKEYASALQSIFSPWIDDKAECQEVINAYNGWATANDHTLESALGNLQNQDGSPNLDETLQFIDHFRAADAVAGEQKSVTQESSVNMEEVAKTLQDIQTRLSKIEDNTDQDKADKKSWKMTKIGIYWGIAAGVVCAVGGAFLGYWLAPKTPTLEDMEKMMEKMMKKALENAIIEARKEKSSDSSSQEQEGVFKLGNGLIGFVPPQPEITPNPPSKKPQKELDCALT